MASQHALVAYRQKVEELAKRRRGTISLIGRKILEELRGHLPEGQEISDAEAQRIEAEVMIFWQQYAKHLKEFEGLLVDLAASSEVLSLADLQELQELQLHWRLAESDVKEIMHRLGIALPSLELASDFDSEPCFLAQRQAAVISSVGDCVLRQELQPLAVESAMLSQAIADSGESSWRVQRLPLQVMAYRLQLAEQVELRMVQVPGGSFLIGSPQAEAGRDDDEGPQRQVQLASFLISQTPITQAQWRVVASWDKLERQLKSDPSRFKGPNRPVEQVSWLDAEEFGRRLSQRTGQLYGLPSEAQWEYACRAGTTTPYNLGDTLVPQLVNYNANLTDENGSDDLSSRQTSGQIQGHTSDVASFPANLWGLHDMHGNVWEWCLDHWHSSYDGLPQDGAAWLDDDAKQGATRILRGGSWTDHPIQCRSADRAVALPSYSGCYLGFRLVCVLQGAAFAADLRPGR
jgi:formylglycine-generating enzyme required for sulfatase activity